ncbi:MAG: hypothetical protein AAGC55_13560, partial [Myxococcota bacterium]
MARRQGSDRRSRCDRAPFTCALVLGMVVGLAAGCSGPATAQPAAVPGAAEPSERVVRQSQLSGSWTWSLVTEQDGVRRIEVERWQLSAQRGRITGQYQRVVTFLTQSGRPFTCNQTLGYQQRTTYQLSGSYRGHTLTLRESAHRVEPSPCDT